MEEDVKRRIKEVLVDYQSNPTQLSKQFGVNQKTLNSQINSATTLSVSTILLVLKAFPDVSAEWLLRGYGKMKNSTAVSLDDTELVTLSCDLVNVLGKIMDKVNKK